MRFPRCSGILLHPSSLPGPFGSGDFGANAYFFVDWLASAGQKMWQILPLGGIGPGNSPYMSSSAFAGNVLFIDLADLRDQGWLAGEDLIPDPGFSASRVDYGRVYPFRMDRLRKAARRFFAGPPGPEYEAFCAAEQWWLDDYALFMALSEKFSWRDWATWEAGLARRESKALARAAMKLGAETAFWKFCQWNFFRQWMKLKQYANGRGVKLIGDIPIFIAYQSAEAWARPDLFDLDEGLRPRVVAGVPPDYFSATGQRWGNPLYRWERHEEEGYAWWVKRLQKKLELVDIVRIDHFRGFAGYWEIPAHEETAVNGRWLPGPGEKLFNALKNALGELPLIAEDLGIVTPDVTALLEKLDLPGMRILQFAFGGGTDNPYLPHNYINNTVVYGGTHDNDTAIGWFNSASERERTFALKYLRTDGVEINLDLIHAASVSIADIAIHAFQDVLGMDSAARMNLPGQPSGYWEWRFTWEEVEPRHAVWLYEISALHGRCPADRLTF